MDLDLKHSKSYDGILDAHNCLREENNLLRFQIRVLEDELINPWYVSRKELEVVFVEYYFI